MGHAPPTGWSVPTRPTSANNRRDRLLQLAANHPDSALGREDAVWWSREAQPPLPAWSDDTPVRLGDKTVPAQDAEGQAVACDGLSVPTANQLGWRGVRGRPVRLVPGTCLAGLAVYLRAQGQRARCLRWDHAAWHVSQAVQAWLTAHHRQANHEGGGRFLVWR